MAMSVRLDPGIEARVGQEAKCLGITQSEYVKDAIERALGLKNPSDLLDLVSSGAPMGDPGASEKVSARVNAKLGAQRPA